MSNLNDKSTTKDEQNDPSQPITTKSNQKRKGKGSQQKSTEKYRQRRNEQQQSAFTKSIEEKYSLFESDTGPLQQALESVTIVAQPCATPLSVTTRGIGIAVALSYSRSATTWSFSAISEIATVHQVYRVALLCVHLKVYLAQQQQVEGVLITGALRRVHLNDDVRELVYQISQVPAVLALVIDCIGKIEHDGRVWHMGYPETDLCRTNEWRYLTVNPDNIRATLDWMSNAETPIAEREHFIRNNSIPGANFENALLTNADEIWPADYGADAIRADIHAFKGWISRVETRLPSHAFPKITWSGRGSAGGLVCSEGVEVRVISKFSRRTPLVASTKRRNAAGDLVEVVVPSFSQLTELTVSGVRAEFWSPAKCRAVNHTMGSASLVGEVCCVETRHGTFACEHFTTDPVTTVMNLCDAPRH